MPSYFFLYKLKTSYTFTYHNKSLVFTNFNIYLKVAHSLACGLMMPSYEGSVAQWIEHQTLNTWKTPGVGSSPTGAKIFVTLLVPLGKALYSNCSVVRRSRKAVGPVYMYLNINTTVHDKERHRLFEKSRGSSRYCWLYFKTTLIYSRFQSMGQGRLWPVWVPFA